ncbi:MAG: non-ribosomal peptide synthetase [Methylotenera sp.]|uniref:non-ribosomal peptide synthetase n=1 Tax=Methylotenera sp. TaxID=2051956 RepID=UPI0027273563|nr:non-ribosomal peptide synthetase [Methylotenera sp.]MDO9150516.1 non-ribosomal peptide synthetase [Methylotenera sp.]
MKNLSNNLSENFTSNIYSIIYLGSQLYRDQVALYLINSPLLTYNQLLLEVQDLIAYLLVNGVSQAVNKRVALVMPNSPEMSVSLLAICSVATAVPFNPNYTEEEYRAYFEQSETQFLLVKDHASLAVKVAHSMEIKVLTYPPRIGALSEISKMCLIPPKPHDIALLMLTSGSTGRSKMVPLSHLNLCSSAYHVAKSLKLTTQDCCLSMWEQFHIGGVVDLLLAPLLVGSKVISAGSFNVENFFLLESKYRPTWFQGVPTTLRELCFFARKINYKAIDSSLRFIRSVAAALHEQSLKEIEQLFSVTVIRTFGMTEAAPLITSTDFETKSDKFNTVGKAYGPEVQIHDYSGLKMDHGEGLIAVRGENIFFGYVGDELANKEAFRNGWFYTGDVGFFDNDGDLFITGRVKEMINRGGEKVSPKEIDEVLLKHPDITQAASFSLPHKTLGEEIGVGLVLRSGCTEDAESIKKFASLFLSEFKIPTRFIFLHDLPRCPVGKVKRQEIAQLCIQLAEGEREMTLPENALESILLLIWMEELDLKELSVNDKFSEVGGDSLSSLRIILRTQDVFKLKITEEQTKCFSSVRKMAEVLIQLGLDIKNVNQIYEMIRQNDFNSNHFKKTLLKTLLMDSVTEKIASNEEISSQVLYQCESIFDFEAYRYAIENISTPAEVLSFLESSPSYTTRILEACQKYQSIGSLVQIAYKRHLMQRAFDNSIRYAEDPWLWKRVQLSSYVDLFTDNSHEQEKKVLIIGFSGRAMRLTTPTYQILNCFSPSLVDLILLRDAGRNHYKYGIPEIGSSPDAVSDWISAFLQESRYEKVVALGTSSGGLMALYAALKNKWNGVLVCGCDRLSEHDAMASLLSNVNNQHNANLATKVICSFSEKNIRDREAAEQLDTVVKHAIMQPDARFKEHAILYELGKRNELKSYFQMNLISM